MLYSMSRWQGTAAHLLVPCSYLFMGMLLLIHIGAALSFHEGVCPRNKESPSDQFRASLFASPHCMELVQERRRDGRS